MSVSAGRPVAGPDAPSVPPSLFSPGLRSASVGAAGLIALLLQKNRLLSAAQIGRILTAAARPGGADGFDPARGFGLIDARAALDLTPAAR